MVGEVFVPNSKSVVHFILVDFGKVGLEFDIKKNWKKIMVQEKFYLSQKFLDPEFFYPKKNLVQQNFESEDILSLKKLEYKKCLSQKICVQKNLFEKNWCPIKYLGPKIFGSQNCWSKNFIGSQKKFYQKS